jgi:hypothetical protein
MNLLRRLDRWREEGEAAILTTGAHLWLIAVSPGAHGPAASNGRGSIRAPQQAAGSRSR